MNVLAEVKSVASVAINSKALIVGFATSYG